MTKKYNCILYDNFKKCHFLSGFFLYKLLLPLRLEKLLMYGALQTAKNQNI